jgi:hypothetical protein
MFSLDMCSRIKDRNRSFVTAPSNMSSAITPSVVNAGRIEWQTPRRNVIRRTQGCPAGDQPYLHCLVLSSTALSSNAMKTSGSKYSAITVSHMLRSCSSRSAAAFVTSFQLRLRATRALEIVETETWTSWTSWTAASLCCNSSRKMDGLAVMIACK